METRTTTNKRPGKIVEFVTNEGVTQKGIAHDDMQNAMFKNIGKVAIHLVNDDLTPKISEQTGQWFVCLRKEDSLTWIGFVD